MDIEIIEIDLDMGVDSARRAEGNGIIFVVVIGEGAPPWVIENSGASADGDPINEAWTKLIWLGGGYSRTKMHHQKHQDDG